MIHKSFTDYYADAGMENFLQKIGLKFREVRNFRKEKIINFVYFVTFLTIKITQTFYFYKQVKVKKIKFKKSLL